MRSLLLGPGSWVIVIVHRRDEIRSGRRKKKSDELVFVDIGVVYLCIDGASKLCVLYVLVYKYAMPKNTDSKDRGTGNHQRPKFMLPRIGSPTLYGYRP